MAKPKTKYRKIAVPEDLCKSVEELITEKKLGFRSISEFIISTTRIELIKLKQLRLFDHSDKKTKTTTT